MKVIKNIYIILFFCLGIISCSKDTNDIGDETTIAIATCGDGIQNGTETGIDCGGSVCDPCAKVTVNIPTTGFESPTSYIGYDLVWSDEFNDENLDSDKWNFHLGNGCPNLCGWGNKELQYYTNNNHSFKEGNLVIEAKKEKNLWI